MADPLPLYVSVDGVYDAKHLAAPWGDVIGEGIIGGAPAGLDPLKVSPTAPAAMAVSIAAGAAWVRADTTDDTTGYFEGGAYRVARPTAFQIPIDAADPTNPRIDRLILEVLDQQFGAASDIARPRVVKGTPAASPTAPAEPRNAITLATITVAAGAATIAAGAITDARPTARTGAGKAAAPTIPTIQYARVYRDTPTGLAQNTDVALIFDKERQDPNGMHDPAVNPSRLTAPVAGFYLIGGWATIVAALAGTLWMKVRQGGTTSLAESRPALYSGGLKPEIFIATGAYLNAGEYVELILRQNDSQPRNCDAAEGWMVRAA